jgi:transposase
MRALTAEVVAAVWSMTEPLLPIPLDTHPLGVHRRRKSNWACFEVILTRLVTGCSWEDAERLCGCKVSDTTARARRDEWIEAGVYEAIFAEARHAYDKIIGLALGDVSADGSLHKSPCGVREPGPTRRIGASSAGSGRSSATSVASRSASPSTGRTATTR